MTEYTYVTGYCYDIEKFDTEFSLSEEAVAFRYHFDAPPVGIYVEHFFEGQWLRIAACDSHRLEEVLAASGFHLTKEKAMEAALSLLRNKQSCYTNKVARLTQKIASIQKLLDTPLA